MKKFAGWTPNSGMASVYVHLSGKDLELLERGEERSLEEALLLAKFLRNERKILIPRIAIV